MPKSPVTLRNEIAALVEEYYKLKFVPKAFVPGDTPVRYASRVVDEKEMVSLVDSALDFWLTSGRFSQELGSALVRRRAHDSK